MADGPTAAAGGGGTGAPSAGMGPGASSAGTGTGAPSAGSGTRAPSSGVATADRRGGSPPSTGRPGLLGDDRGQLFLLAGLVLAMAIVTVSIVVTTSVQAPARIADAQRPVALNAWEDYRTNARDALSFLINSIGITDESLTDEIRRLSDARRLGVAGRDVDAYLAMNGSLERALCEEDPPYASAGLDGIARRADGLLSGPCHHPDDRDGVIEDGAGDVIAVAVDVGIEDPAYSVVEPMVVVETKDIFYFRRFTNVTVGATVADGPRATDFHDDAFHVLEPARSNVPVVRGYAAIPHPQYTGSDLVAGSRVANWSVVVANPTDDPIRVDRIEVFTSEGIFTAAVGPESPPGWKVEGSGTGPQETIVNGGFEADPNGPDELDGWQWTRTAQAGDVDPQLDVVKNDADGCKKLGAGNACVRYRTRDDVDRTAQLDLHQEFESPPALAEATLRFKYQTASDTLASNALTVWVEDDGGNVVDTWTPTLDPGTPVDPLDLTGWYAVERDLTADLIPDQVYELHINVTQELDPDPLLALPVRATAWFDDVSLSFTRASQALVWDGTPVDIGPNASVEFRTGARAAEFAGTPQALDFQVSVRDVATGSERWFNHTNPDYNTTRGPLQPTASVALNVSSGPAYEAGWARTSVGGRTETWQVVVEEASGFASLSTHELEVLLPTGWTLGAVESEDCGGGVPCYVPTAVEPLATGTRITLASQVPFLAGSEHHVNLTVTPPSVANQTLYKAALRLHPTGPTDDLWAAADPVLTVLPQAPSVHSIDAVYYSERVDQKVDADRIAALQLRLDLSASRHVPVRVQIWNTTNATANDWAWRDLGDAVADFQGTSLRVRLKDDNATSMGVTDEVGRLALLADTPPADGTLDEPGHVAIRLLTDEEDGFRLYVNVAQFRIEYV